MPRYRISGTSNEDPRLVQAALDAANSQTALTNAQIQAIAEELGLKREALGIEREKLGVGREEISSKDRQAKLAAAIEALGLGSKEKIASQAERVGIQSDLTKRPDITIDILARALAEGGDPSLYNALVADKAQKRETTIQSIIPELKKARSDAEREKKFKPSLEAFGEGTYDEAVARAWPKPGQPTTTPKPSEGVNTQKPQTGNDMFAALAARLLGGAGVTPSGETGAAQPRSPNEIYLDTARALTENPSTYADLSVGALEGSTRRDLAGGLSELATPSGGTIRFKTPVDERANAVLNRFITPRSEQATANIPAPMVDLVKPPPLDFSNLLTNEGGRPPVGLPTPTPPLAQVVKEATPVPAATPAASPVPPELLAELLRLEEERRRRALLNQQ